MDDEATRTDDVRAAYAATRRILRAHNVLTAQRALHELCLALGADFADADEAGEHAIPLDISLGLGSPQVPVSADPQVRDAVAEYVVAAVSDARAVVERAISADRRIESAMHDPLTGLLNRTAMTMAVSRARVGDAIALLDLDEFRLVTDEHGHEAGDVVLAAFGEHLRSELRDRDVVGRLGGEEFVLLLPSTALEEALLVVHRLRADWPAVSPRRVTFSAGVADVLGTSESYQHAGHDALHVADRRMAVAKADGRDRIVSGDAQPAAMA